MIKGKLISELSTASQEKIIVGTINPIETVGELGELTRKSSSYRSELCYKVKGFSCGSLEQKFEHLADALWHELRIKGNLQNRKTIKISNTVPSSPRIKKLCLEIFQERFIGTYIKFAVDDSALNQSKLTAGLRNFVWRFFRSGLLEHILNLLLMIAH